MKNKILNMIISLALSLCFISPVSAESQDSSSISPTANGTNLIDLESLEIGDHIQQDYAFTTDEGITVNTKVDIYVEEPKATRETGSYQDDLIMKDGKQYKLIWTWDREAEGYILGGSFTSTNVIAYKNNQISAVSTSINAVAPSGYTIHSKDAYFTKDNGYDVHSTGVVEARLLTDFSPIHLKHVITFKAEMCTTNTIRYSFNYKS